MSLNYKNRYHSLYIVLYHSSMLSPEQVRCIPRSTRNEWDKITFAIQRVACYGKVNITDACSVFNVNRNWFYRHRKKITCNKSKIGNCFWQYPNQLTYEEAEQIEKIVAIPENKRKTKTTLYYDAMRKGLIASGLSTFFKYADLTGYVKLPKTLKEERPKGFRAIRPFEWLHVDVTHIQTIDDGVQYVALIKDNYSTFRTPSFLVSIFYSYKFSKSGCLIEQKNLRTRSYF